MTKKTRLIILVLIILTGAILVFGYLTGPDQIFRMLKIRTDTLTSKPGKEKNFTDASLCKKCHFAIDSLKMKGSHKKLNCQFCHGPDTNIFSVLRKTN